MCMHIEILNPDAQTSKTNISASMKVGSVVQTQHTQRQGNNCQIYRSGSNLHELQKMES